MKTIAKYIALSLILASASVGASAQHKVIVDEKVTCIGSSKYADLLRAKVMKALGEVGFIQLMDANAATNEEAEFSLAMQLGEPVELPIYDKNEDTAFKYHYKVPFTLRIVRLSDKSVFASKTFSFEGYAYNTVDEAIEDSFDSGARKVLLFINEKLPIEGELLEISVADGKKAKEVYISLGSINGIQKGQSLNVKGVTMIAGKPVARQLGKVKVEEIEGEDASRCKVTDGHEKIYQFYQQNPDQLIVQTERGWGLGDWWKTMSL